MTVLDLDPPQRSLRLVSSNDNAPARDHRYRSGAVLAGDARSLYSQVLQTALVEQVAINPDALRVVLATKQATQACSAHTFTAAGIWQLMFVDVLTWCQNRQLDVPSGCATALQCVLHYLDTHELLASQGDDIYDLYDAIDECTGGWAEPEHPSATPAKARRSLRSSRGRKST